MREIGNEMQNIAILWESFCGSGDDMRQGCGKSGLGRGMWDRSDFLVCICGRRCQKRRAVTKNCRRIRLAGAEKGLPDAAGDKKLSPVTNFFKSVTDETVDI